MHSARISGDIMQDEIDRLMMEIQRSRYTERRTEARQPFVRPVRIHPLHGPTARVFSKDMSSQGIGVISDVPFPTGTVATLEIHSMQGDPVFLRSEARWSDAYGKGWFLIGWKFIGLAARPAP